ncbi:hypothetical protein ACWDKQ_28500 [Saccharopolyspora sp. NPDC000995]
MIAHAGSVVAVMVADIEHHHTADGEWAVCGGPADEWVRLAEVLGNVEAAVREARRRLAPVRRAAVARAVGATRRQE